MIFTYLERLCTALDHRIEPLCKYVIRFDSAWRDRPAACERHHELREAYVSGMRELPFPVGAPMAVNPPESIAHVRERRAKSA